MIKIFDVRHSAIEHVHIYGLYLLPTANKFLILSRRLVTLFSRLQTLSIDVISFNSSYISASQFYYSKFWKRIGKLVVGAASLTSLALSSDSCSDGPQYDTWDAMSLPF